MNKTTKLIVMSLLTVAMCVSLVAGATFALFTSQSNIDITVSSGKVEVSATVSGLMLASDTTDAYPAELWQPAVEEAGVYSGEFANDGTASYADNKLVLTNITPGDAVKFSLDIVNGSTVKVKYRVQVKVESDNGLAKHLQFSVDGAVVALDGSKVISADWIQLDVGSNPEAPAEVIIALPSAVTSEQAADNSCTITLSVLAVQANGNISCAEAGVAHNYVDDKCTFCGEANIFMGSDEHEESGDNYIIKKAPAGVTELEIPGTINGKHVEIKASAFANNTELQSVVLDEGIDKIPNSAFKGCTELTSVTLDESVETIGQLGFYGCESLEEINLEDVTKLGSGTFYGCTGLREADLTGVTSLANQAFDGCSSLENVTLGEGIPQISYYTFRNCTSLREITIPGSVKNIFHNAFVGCTKLETVTLEEGVEKIDDAFTGTAIKEIRLPDSLVSLGNAFKNCEQLTTVYIGSEHSSLENLYYYHDQGAGWVKFASFAFYGNFPSLERIVFAGSKADWEAMSVFVATEVPTNGSAQLDKDASIKVKDNNVASYLFVGEHPQITIECNDGETITIEKQ